MPLLIPDKIIYTAEVTATGGREGEAKSNDDRLAVALAIPKEMGGAGGPGTNPEQLFAAGYAACFLGAVNFVGRAKKIAVPADISVNAKVGMGPIANGYALTVELEVSLPGMDSQVAQALVADAHQRCPYSNATRGNVEVKLTVV